MRYFSAVFVSVFIFSCSPKKKNNTNDAASVDRAGIDPHSDDFQQSDFASGSFENLSTTSSLKVESFNPKKANDFFKKLLQEIKTPSPSCQSSNHYAEKKSRIITREEYRQSLLNIFDIDLNKEKLFSKLPIETKILNFNNMRNSNVMSVEKLKAFSLGAEHVASLMQNKIDSAMNCGKGEEICFQTWIQSFLPLLWRKNLSKNDIAQEMVYYKNLGGGKEGAYQMLQRYLISPYFLYRIKTGSKDLSSWEIATLLSDSLWQGRLDQNLVQKAINNKFQSLASIQSEIDRMMKSPYFYGGLTSWSHAWLGTDLITTKMTMNINGKSATELERKNLSHETGAFLYHLSATNNDSIQNIFSSNITILPDDLINTYQFTQESQAAQGLPDNLKVAKYPSNRAGILNQPSVIMNISSSSHTNIPLRGKHILGDFLCHHLETPENLLAVIGAIKFDLEETTLNAVKKATSQGSCAECHSLINGPAGVLEQLSPEGFLRTQDDHSKDIQTTTETLTTILGDKYEVQSHKDLSETVGQTLDARACITLNVFRMVHSRLEKDNDICHIADVYRRSKGNSEEVTLQNIFKSFLSDPSFLGN